MSDAQKQSNSVPRDLLGRRPSPQLSRGSDSRITPRRQAPSPLQVSETSAMVAEKYTYSNSNGPESPTSMRAPSGSQHSPQSPHTPNAADQDQPNPPWDRLDQRLTTAIPSTFDNIGQPSGSGDPGAAKVAPLKTQSYNQLRNVSSPFPQARPVRISPPRSPSSTNTLPLANANARQEPRPMPRTSSIDSAISTISTATTQSQKSSVESYAPNNNDISKLIATAGSPELVIQHLLKENQHSATQKDQLWKLVDKQRALILGLNQDLERAVKDKEHYRKKLKESMAQAVPVPTAATQISRKAPSAGSKSTVPSEPRDDVSGQSSSVRDREIFASPETGLGRGTVSNTGHVPETKPACGRTILPENRSNIRAQGTSAIDSEALRKPTVNNEGDIPRTRRSVHNITPIQTTELDGSGQGSSLTMPLQIPQSANAVVSPNSFTAKRSQPGPSLQTSEPTPPDKLFERTLPPSRKLPPAPLNLGSPSQKKAQPAEFGPEDYSGSEYEDSMEVEEMPGPERRGRNKTRAEDDKEREVALHKEQEGRSRSSKKGKGSKPPVEPAMPKSAATTIVVQPPQMPIPSNIKAVSISPDPSGHGNSGYLQEPASLAGVLSPPGNPPQANTAAQIIAIRSLSPSLSLSPGLPLSPRPGDRPVNAPTPRMPRDAAGKLIVSPPLSPRNGFIGLPLSPRAPRQTIPFPPNTPMSMSSPVPRHVEPRKEASETKDRDSLSPLQSPVSPLSPTQVGHGKGPRSSATRAQDMTRPRGVYRGFISDTYPDLLIPPNALPSIIVRVISSRLKPARHSYLAPKGSEEEPVFTLGVSARSDGRELWQVEKPLLSLPALDYQLKQMLVLGAKLPERTLFSGHAPAKIDARKLALEAYFETVLDTPMDDKAALVLCQYLSTQVLEPRGEDINVTSEAGSPVTLGPNGKPLKEGYLTKRGKNFGGWKARFFILDEPILRYYESPGGSLLGTIKLQHAQIGKQSATHTAHSPSRAGEENDNQYRHAFLILEPKRKDSNSLVRHVLCAESDAERDLWVETLLYYVDSYPGVGEEIPRPAPPKSVESGSGKLVKKPPSKKDGAYTESPDSETFDGLQGVSYENTVAAQAPLIHVLPEQRATDSPSPPISAAPPAGRAPLTQAPKNISGPSNGTRIQDVGAWGNKSKPAPQPKDKEHKKRSIWGFRDRNPSDLATNHSNDSSLSLTQQQFQERTANVRAAFGASLAEAVEFCPPRGIDVGLPAVVYRCLEYLEANDASSEEGIFRLSGSSVVIKGLRDRFNTEGDFDFLADEQFYDVHAVASLLKLYLRELPSTVLTRELHFSFLQVLDIHDKSDKIAAYNILVHKLPKPNWFLIRALSAFLIGIVNNSDVNKMSVRNVGIVFSPTLNIPAPVFAMFLTEFDAIFGEEPEDIATPPEQVSVIEPLTPEDIRSPRRQMFSDIPTPSYTQDTFPSQNPSYEQVLRESREEHDTGFIPLQPSYEPPSTSGAYPFNQAQTGSVTMPGPEYGAAEYGVIGRGARTPQSASKARRRESSMLLVGPGPGVGGQRKSSMPMLRGDPI